MNSLGVGIKGQKQRRMRQYHSSNKATSAIDQSPFLDIWHNNKPLEILYVRDIPESKSFCTYCGLGFIVVQFQMYLSTTILDFSQVVHWALVRNLELFKMYSSYQIQQIADDLL